MARQPTGQIIEQGEGRTYRRLRFTAYGKRHLVSLGVVTQREAEKESRGVLADVERGTWQPPQVIEASEQPQMPTFHQFAEQWWELKRGQITEGTRADYRTRLLVHLIPYFGEMPLDAITLDAVERFMAEKIADGLSARTVNMQMTLLAAILERAVERELIPRNPAKGKGRRVRERAPQRSYWTTLGGSRRCWTPLASWTAKRPPTASTSSAGR